MTYTKWNPFGSDPAERAEIRETLANDGTVRQIARRFGVTRRTVQSAMRRHGIMAPYGWRPDPCRRAEVMAAVASGRSALREIAAVTGRSRAAVKRILYELRDRGLLRMTGSNRLSRWAVTSKWTDGRS